MNLPTVEPNYNIENEQLCRICGKRYGSHHMTDDPTTYTCPLAGGARDHSPNPRVYRGVYICVQCGQWHDSQQSMGAKGLTECVVPRRLDKFIG